MDDAASLSLFSRVLRLRTVSGEGPSSGAYRACAALLVEELSRLVSAERGDEVTTHEFVANKPVVLCTVRGDNPDLPGVLFNAHYDVVPVVAEAWTVDPFAATVKNGRVYGRGTQDMKCVVAAYVAALSRVLAGGRWRPKRTLHFSFVPDEEIGGADGALKFVQSDVFKHRVAPVACALDEGLANPNDAFTVFYGERAPMWLIITAKGPTGHGSRFVQDTATERLSRFLSQAWAFRRKEEEIFQGKRASDGCTHCEAKKLGDVTTLNVTMLRSGVPQGGSSSSSSSSSAGGGSGAASTDEEDRCALNVIPTQAKAGMDIRVPPHVPIEKIKAMLDEWCRAEQDMVEWKFAPWTPAPNRHAVTSLDPAVNPMWTVLRSTVENECGVRLETEVFPAGTDSRFIRELDIPAFGFSPMRKEPILLHEHDESIGVDTYHECVRVYERVLKAFGDCEDGGAADAAAKKRAKFMS